MKVTTNNNPTFTLELSQEEAEFMIDFFGYNTTIPEALQDAGSDEFAEKVGDFMNEVRTALETEVNKSELEA